MICSGEERMRTLIDIPQETVIQLDSFAKQSKISRSALIRAAIDLFLKQQRKEKTNVFGLLKNENIPDGVIFQDQIRDEWS